MGTYLQTDRPLQLKTPLGEDVLLLLGFAGAERLSECYRYVLDLASENASIAAADLLRKQVTVEVQLPDESMRTIHGWVSRFAQLQRDQAGMTYYRAEIVPELWFLSLWHDCRIFQNKNAKEIVESVLSQRSIGFRDDTTATPPTREYCVQYRETDLDFVCRLLEEEGFYFYFDHRGSKEELVLTDGNSNLKDIAIPNVRYEPQVQLDEDVLLSLQAEQAVHSSKATLTDYNMETPATSLLRSVDSTTAGAGEDYYDYPGKHPTGDIGDQQVRLIIGHEEAEEQVVRGVSNCRAFASGGKFTLTGHYNGALNQVYVLTSVSHRVRGGLYRSGEAPVFQYENEYVAIPVSRKYVPPRMHPKPVVRGSQTAVVVGPNGEEIYVDKYGRVKVQFFWDRLGTKDENSSCWMRVSTAWAGKNWGTIHIPRIGQEVVVDFLEGDPDRPLVTGSVYNAEMMPPYALPGEMTKSGIKSRSTKEGAPENFNMIFFEDKKGSELFDVQAEKDMTTIVKNDETREVRHDRITTITHDDTRTVKEGKDTHTIEKGDQKIVVLEGKQTIEVKGDQAVTVQEGNQTIDVKMGDQTTTIHQGHQNIDVKTGNQITKIEMGNQETSIDMGNQSITLKLGNRTIKLNLGSISEEAMQGIELKVGQSSVKIDQMGVQIKGMMIKVEGQVQTEVKGLITQINGSAMLMAKGGITMIN